MIATEITRTGYFCRNTLIDWSLYPMGRMPWICLHLWGFLCVRDAGRRGNKITGGLWARSEVCFCSFCLGVFFEISGQSSYQFNKFPSKSGVHNIIQYRPFLMKKQCYQQVYLSQTKVHYEACVAELFHTWNSRSRGPGFLAMPFALFL